MNAPSTLPSGDQVPAQTPKMNATQERALALLGDGFPPSIVASSVGVSESYISQLMSLDWFAAQVQEMKFLNLKKHTELDNMYDDLEFSLVQKLEKLSKLLVKPKDVADVLKTINGAKRRGAGSSSVDTPVQQNVINLTIPVALIHKFTSNVNNQVVEVHDGDGNSRTLVTAPSSSLERLSREVREAKELSASLSGTGATNLLEGETSDSSDRSKETISSETLAALALVQAKKAGIATDTKALVKGLNESERTSGKIAAEDL